MMDGPQKASKGLTCSAGSFQPKTLKNTTYGLKKFLVFSGSNFKYSQITLNNFKICTPPLPPPPPNLVLFIVPVLMLISAITPIRFNIHGNITSVHFHSIIFLFENISQALLSLYKNTLCCNTFITFYKDIQ